MLFACHLIKEILVLELLDRLVLMGDLVLMVPIALVLLVLARSSLMADSHLERLMLLTQLGSQKDMLVDAVEETATLEDVVTKQCTFRNKSLKRNLESGRQTKIQIIDYRYFVWMAKQQQPEVNNFHKQTKALICIEKASHRIIV